MLKLSGFTRSTTIIELWKLLSLIRPQISSPIKFYCEILNIRVHSFVYIGGSPVHTLLSMQSYSPWICQDESHGHGFLRTFCSPFAHLFPLTLQLIPNSFQPCGYPKSLFPSVQASSGILNTMNFLTHGPTKI